MAGPSLSGPLTPGWTAASLAPAATVAVATPLNSLKKYAIGKAVGDNFGSGAGGGGGGGSSSSTDPRAAAAPKGTPLEQLLASIFPDAATSTSPVSSDGRAATEKPSIINNILGNLGLGIGGGGGFGYVAPPVPTSNPGAGIASTIPGAPSFLSGAINQVLNPGASAYGPPSGGGGGGGGNLLSGIAALAAEQRIQQMEAEQQQRDALEAQRQAALDISRRRFAANRFDTLKNSTPGWGTTSVINPLTAPWTQNATGNFTPNRFGAPINTVDIPVTARRTPTPSWGISGWY